MCIVFRANYAISTLATAQKLKFLFIIILSTYSFASEKLYRCFRCRSVFSLQKVGRCQGGMESCHDASSLNKLSQNMRSAQHKKGQAPLRKVVNNCIRNETIILHNLLVVSQQLVLRRQRSCSQAHAPSKFINVHPKMASVGAEFTAYQKL